jgi:hypothetical protein
VSAAPGPARSPLRQVLDALERGASTADELRRRSDLDPGVVDAALAHLVRTGRVTELRPAAGCATGCGSAVSGCGGCPVNVTGRPRYR